MSEPTEAGPDPVGDRDPGIEQRLRAIAAGLTAAGLDAHVHETKGVLDLTATARHTGGKDVEIICDEDLYVQIAYWNDPSTSPTEVVAVIGRALRVITSSS
jgi:hypothetical protein